MAGHSARPLPDAKSVSQSLNRFELSEEDALGAAMPCPFCQQQTTPTPTSTIVVAWYRCQRCDAEWSARLRDGRPTSLNEWIHSEILRPRR
jgi:hypothetical protein